MGDAPGPTQTAAARPPRSAPNQRRPETTKTDVESRGRGFKSRPRYQAKRPSRADLEGRFHGSCSKKPPERRTVCPGAIRNALYEILCELGPVGHPATWLGYPGRLA